MSSNISTFFYKEIAMVWYFSRNIFHVQPSVKELVPYIDGTGVLVDWFWQLIRLSFHFEEISRFFLFWQVKLRYTWYPLDAILGSNKYILLSAIIQFKKLILVKICAIRFPKPVSNVRIP